VATHPKPKAMSEDSSSEEGERWLSPQMGLMRGTRMASSRAYL